MKLLSSFFCTLCLSTVCAANQMLWMGSTTGNVFIADTKTLTQTAQISVGTLGGSLAHIVFTPDGTKALALAQNPDNLVGIIDTATNNLLAKVNVGVDPIRMGITTDSTRAFIANNGSTTVSVLDLTSHTVIQTVDFGVGSTPNFVAVTPDNRSAYIATSNNKVGVIDVQTLMSTSITVAASSSLSYVAITPDGSQVWASDAVSNKVAIIDTSTNTVINTVSLGAQAGGPVVFTHDGTKAYVSSGHQTNTITYVDTQTLSTQTITFTSGMTTDFMALNGDQTKLYVADQTTSFTHVVDTTTNTFIKTVQVGPNPDKHQLATDDSVISAPSTSTNQMSLINTKDENIKNFSVGSPSDILTHGVFFPKFPSAEVEQTIFLTQTDLVNALTGAYVGTGFMQSNNNYANPPVAYNIYSDPGYTHLVARSSGNSLNADLHNQHKGSTVFYVQTVDAHGFTVNIGPFRFNQK